MRKWGRNRFQIPSVGTILFSEGAWPPVSSSLEWKIPSAPRSGERFFRIVLFFGFRFCGGCGGGLPRRKWKTICSQAIKGAKMGFNASFWVCSLGSRGATLFASAPGENQILLLRGAAAFWQGGKVGTTHRHVRNSHPGL